MNIEWPKFFRFAGARTDSSPATNAPGAGEVVSSTPEQAVAPSHLTSSELACQPLTQRAIRELDAGRIKRAQRLADEAAAAHEPAAEEFLIALKDVRAAIRTVQRSPRSPQGHLVLAYAFYLAEAGQRCLFEATRALALNPRLGEAYALRGIEYGFRGMTSQAIAEYRRAQTLLPADSVWLQQLQDLATEASQRDANQEPAIT